MQRIRAVLAVVVSATALVGGPTAAPAHADNPTVYRVTIRNLTVGQALTPPVIATHRRPGDAFSVGAPASVGVKEIAENGNLGPMLDALASDSHVFDIETGSAPVVPSGRVAATGFSDSVTLTITADRGAKYLSWVSMLICTNDGFTGLDGVRLPGKLGETTVLHTNGYDAGTEINTEDFADIVPPCPPLSGVPSSEPGTGASNPALAEGGVIHHHPGIVGVADLQPAVHGWTDPVAVVEITALN
jgi:Spondin_N